MEQSKSPYSLFFCAKALHELITVHWNSITAADQHEEIRKWLLSFVGLKVSEFPPFVRRAILSILCRITKMGWLDNDSFREIPQDVHKYFICNPQTPQQKLLGLDLLNELVKEINMMCPQMTLSRHRRTIVSFKDGCLLDIFKVALTSLENAAQVGLTGADVDISIALALSCLSYDFVGIYFDESGEDTGTVQVPSTWKPYIASQSTLRLFWTLYKMANQEKPPPPRSEDILKCMVQFASVRRSLFNPDSERVEYLSCILEGILEALKGNIGLDDPGSYHEFCRLLSRIKPNYQLAELVNMPNYEEWLRATAEFTVKSFREWRQTASSGPFLLSLWSRLLQAKPYLTHNDSKPSLLETYAPDVVFSYIQSRLELARACIETPNDIDNSLEDREMLIVQLDSLPILAKSLYSKVGPFLMQEAQPDYNSLGGLLTSIRDNVIPADQQSKAFLELQILDTRLSWLVYMMGVIIRQHTTMQEPQAEEQDGTITAFVLGLAQVVMQRVELLPSLTGMKTLQRLVLAILYFLDGFREVHVGETAQPTSKVFQSLGKLTNGTIQDSIGVMGVIVEMILNVLKVWKSHRSLVDEALSLLWGLTRGYASSRLLMRVDGIKTLLQNHTHPQFSFMDEPQNLKQRSTFYRCLGSLVFLQPDASFEEFMVPFREKAMSLVNLPAQQFLSPDVKVAVVAWLRDMRGICKSCTTKRQFALFFEWMFPFISNHSTGSSEPPLLLKICQVIGTDNAVVIPLLRFFSDFARNDATRIAFEASSPNGILLFRETSALLTCFGRAKLMELFPQCGGGWVSALPPCASETDTYKKTYKPILLIMQVLFNSLSGGYCNFGVFGLYGDRALEDALEVTLKLMLSLSSDDLLAYQKLGSEYFRLVEYLLGPGSHVPFLLQLPTPQFMQLLATLEKGIVSIELSKQTSIRAANSIGYLCTCYFTQNQKANKEVNTVGKQEAIKNVQQLRQHFSQDPGMTSRVLSYLFHQMLFDEGATTQQWALSRPMLPIILVAETFLQGYRAQLMQKVSDPRRAEVLSEAFSDLMKDVKQNLDQTNRDAFTRNIHQFRAKVRGVL
eukprot:TRINITY_DN24182_c0_g1_i1.p1 TRINITY_DN24182_c0_g1~~TRINITY_DN24182_c0_g1_i1.p1  ORF type:complete len:1151 (+),score=487.80 TRINITY_DN24182_c0_g1_i1:239-3454(+)